MRILIIEDSEKHLKDARKHVVTLKGCKVDFATTLAEAMDLLQKNHYDGVISDVFFPATTGASAETFENAITLSAKLIELGIHHVFNTAGNHHGKEYEGFLWKTPMAIHNNNNSHFLTTGMIIENYKGDSSRKQWQAAFRYILLVLALLQLPDKGHGVIAESNVSDSIDEERSGFPYGEYGELTKKFKKCTHPFIMKVWQKYNA